MLLEAENADFLNQLASLDLQISDHSELQAIYHEQTVNMENAHDVSEALTVDQQHHEQTAETEDISEHPDSLTPLKEPEEIMEEDHEQMEVVGGHETETIPW